MSNGAALRLRIHDPSSGDESDYSLCTLREFFERWYLAHVLNDSLERERPAAESTVALYRDAIGWWERLTRNPRAEEIVDADAVEFLNGLTTATFRRTPFGVDRLLSPSTRAKHVSTIRALLSKLVDDGRGRGHSLDVLQKRVRLRKPSVSVLPKSTPPIATFLDIVTRLRTDPAFSKLIIPHADGSKPVLWWRAFLGTLYAHGWRINTAMALRKGMIAGEEILRLRVPAEAVGKTHKAAIRPVPAWLKALWDEANVSGPFILGQAGTQRWMLEGWHRIQTAAGVSAKFSLHSIRRLHSVEVGKTGFRTAEGLARDTLQHASAETTRTHYAGSLLELAILKLPPAA